MHADQKKTHVHVAIFNLLLFTLSHRMKSNGYLIQPTKKVNNQRTRMQPGLFSQIEDSPTRSANQDNEDDDTTVSSQSYVDDEFIDHIVTLSKPMGLVIEEADANNARSGVQISSINSDGAGAWKNICVGDKILEIDENNCSEKTFDEVMEIIISSPSKFIRLTLGRPSKAVSVRWPNGVGVASLPGKYLGNVAVDALYYDIDYSCQSGSCATCEQRMISDGSEDGARYVRPCVARVPSGVSSVVIEPSDRDYLK